MRHTGLLASCVLVATSLLLASGCLVVRPHRHHGPPHVPPGHVKRGIPPGHAKRAVHVHGHGCGHVFRDGRWVSIEIGVGF